MDSPENVSSHLAEVLTEDGDPDIARAARTQFSGCSLLFRQSVQIAVI